MNIQKDGMAASTQILDVLFVSLVTQQNFHVLCDLFYNLTQYSLACAASTLKFC